MIFISTLHLRLTLTHIFAEWMHRNKQTVRSPHFVAVIKHNSRKWTRRISKKQNSFPGSMFNFLFLSPNILIVLPLR